MATKKRQTKKTQCTAQSVERDSDQLWQTVNGLCVRLNSQSIRIHSLETQLQEMATNQTRLTELLLRNKPEPVKTEECSDVNGQCNEKVN